MQQTLGFRSSSSLGHYLRANGDDRVQGTQAGTIGQISGWSSAVSDNRDHHPPLMDPADFIHFEHPEDYQNFQGTQDGTEIDLEEGLGRASVSSRVSMASQDHVLQQERLLS